MAAAAATKLTAEEFAVLDMEAPTPEKPRVRKKVPLGKGFGPLDWARLSQSSGRSLAQADGAPNAQVTLAELQRHNTKDDCWLAVHGRVYNISAYLPYHPGGWPILEKVAGRDATRYFLYFHSFVNYEKLLENCLVGVLVS